jgi:hypothetical protein
MKNLLFVAFLFASLFLFSNQSSINDDAKKDHKFELPAKITIKGTCVDLLTIEYADGSADFEVYCEGKTGDCVTYDNGSLSTHNCPCDDLLIPNAINFNVEDIGSNTQKVTFSKE